MSLREILECEINRLSYLTIKPECGGEWSKICVNAGKDLCKKCQQIQCDAAGGGFPDPSEYKWRVTRIRRKKNEQRSVVENQIFT